MKNKILYSILILCFVTSCNQNENGFLQPISLNSYPHKIDSIVKKSMDSIYYNKNLISTQIEVLHPVMKSKNNNGVIEEYVDSLQYVALISINLNNETTDKWLFSFDYDVSKYWFTRYEPNDDDSVGFRYER